MNEAGGNTIVESVLGGGGPVVALTAGKGSAGQKTWTLTRPITLIGSRRPAHILLHQPSIQPAHCVIVVTPRAAVAVDLLTPSGTRCNGVECRKRALDSGDVLQVGPMRIEVTLQSRPEDSPSTGGAGGDGAVAGEQGPIVLIEEPSGRTWRVDGPVALVGSRSGVDIQLQSALVADVHAVLFRYGEAFAVFDVSPRGGVMINGWPARLAALATGDRIQIGSSLLLIGADSDAIRATVEPRAPQAAAAPPAPIDGRHAWSWLQRSERPDQDEPLSVTPARDAADGTSVQPIPQPTPPMSADQILGRLSEKLGGIESRLTASWLRLNDQRLSGGPVRPIGEDPGVNLARRVAELDALDAALRGHLFDLTRAHEQLSACQKDMLALVRHWAAEAQNLPPG